MGMTQTPIDHDTNQQLAKLNEKLAKQLSFKRNFLLSIVSGVGYAIGAGLIAAVVIGILSRTIHSIQDVPVLDKLFGNPEVQKTLHTIEESN